MFLHAEVVSTSPKYAAGLPPIIKHPQLYIQCIHSHHTYRKLFLQPQPEETPCHSDTDPLITENIECLKLY